MFIQVVCQNPVHSGRTRAKRRFTNGTRYRLEVIDREEDFFEDAAKKFGDMSRINRAGVEALKADPVFSILEDGAVGDSISSGLIESLKAQLGALNSDLSNARVENERLKMELAAAKAENDDLKSAKGGETVAEPVAQPDPEPAEEPEHKHGSRRHK